MLAIIPARKNSMGVQGKCIFELRRRSLVARGILSAKGSKKLGRINFFNFSILLARIPVVGFKNL